MSSEHLPATGSIKVTGRKKAAKLVERVARDTEDPSVLTEQLLIVLDIDGTLILADESLSPGVVQAVEHAHQTGHEVMIATGRSWEGTRGILRVLKIAPEFVVCSNGAVVLRRLDADELRYERFHIETFDPTEVLTQLRQHLPEHGSNHTASCSTMLATSTTIVRAAPDCAATPPTSAPSRSSPNPDTARAATRPAAVLDRSTTR